MYEPAHKKEETGRDVGAELAAEADVEGGGFEPTPIFRALTLRAEAAADQRADPQEHFRRDPLAAPLPAAKPGDPSGNRMMLHPVPNGQPESNRRRRHGTPAEPPVDRPETPATSADQSSMAQAHPSRGRHRTLRAVGRQGTSADSSQPSHRPR